MRSDAGDVASGVSVVVAVSPVVSVVVEMSGVDSETVGSELGAEESTTPPTLTGPHDVRKQAPITTPRNNLFDITMVKVDHAWFRSGKSRRGPETRENR